jgi:hypothetical protein
MAREGIDKIKNRSKPNSRALLGQAVTAAAIGVVAVGTFIHPAFIQKQ